jgi:hypothetical protein
MSEIGLTAAGLDRASEISRKDFAIMIGSNTLTCDRFQAAFLSPRVSRALVADPTVDRFVIDVPECTEMYGSGDSDLLSLLENLISGHGIIVGERDLKRLLSISQFLENGELSEALFSKGIGGGELSVSNCIERFFLRSALGVSVDAEIDFIASHFYEIGLDCLSVLTPCAIERILEHENLCVDSEDSLFDIVEGLGCEYVELLC